MSKLVVFRWLYLQVGHFLFAAFCPLLATLHSLLATLRSLLATLRCSSSSPFQHPTKPILYFVIFVNEYVNTFQTMSEVYRKHSKFLYDISIIHQKGTIGKTNLFKTF
jgi:hypothetical protein